MKRICTEHIIGECRNPLKGLEGKTFGISNEFLECPYCLRENGCDKFGNRICSEEQAKKLFELLKDKVKD
jgi:hypothetical protein